MNAPPNRIIGRTMRRPAALAALGGLVVSALLLVRANAAEAFLPSGQWDFETYYYAVQVYRSGGDPYDRQQLASAAGHWVQPFVYPHHTLWFFAAFRGADLEQAKHVYLAVKLACLAVLLAIWSLLLVEPGVRLWF